MGIRSIIVGVFMVLMVVWSAGAQQGHYPIQSPTPARMPYGQPPAGPYTTGPPQAYGVPPQPPTSYHPIPAPGGSRGGGAEWPHYPYSRYHNPYYKGMNPKDALAGTIDWFFNLPAILMDRVSNFLDGNVFPERPATSGANWQQLPQGPPTNQVNPGALPNRPQPGAQLPQR